jgi:putative transposase
MAIEKELLDQLLAGRDPQEVFGKDGLVDELKKALSERILNTELDEHLGSEPEKGSGNMGDSDVFMMLTSPTDCSCLNCYPT